ncbi:MAG TPA: AAA family ATPase [Rhizomicrobium sp.]|jgi:exopolysaccharide/PEP-CTERM locus tyrosine autokinase|nr:AAA family ATPase [Rhizomicrobium sp.]
MADSTPDLVMRAAARLAKAGRATGLLSGDVQPDASVPRAGVETPRPASSPAPEALRNTTQGRSVNLSPTALAANGIVLPSSGFSRTVEEFRSIKRQLLANAAQIEQPEGARAARLIMVTSAAPGEGKTYTAINLALALAFEKDINVLLIDADAHRQSMLSYLGISMEYGWLDLLTDDRLSLSDVVLRTNVANLSVLPTGKLRSEIPEIMSSRKMNDFLNGLVQDPNLIVVLDCLPCLVSAEPAVLGSIVGQTLFVVAAGETSRDEVESSLRLIEACPSVSLLLNKGDPLLVDQFSKYGYGYYYPGGK